MPTSSEISLNPTSSKGDILTSNGSSRVRFPVGSDGQFLVADSSQSSGLRWTTVGVSSGDVYNKISQISITSGNIEVNTFSNIPGTYSSLRMIISAYAGNAGFVVLLTANNSTSSVYSSHCFYLSGTTTASGGVNNTRSDGIYLSYENSVRSTAYQTNIVVDIPDYTATDKHKIFIFRNCYMANNTSNTHVVAGTGAFRSTSAITRLDVLSNGTGNGFGDGTVISLYGIKRSGL